MSTRLNYDYSQIMKDPHDILELRRRTPHASPIVECPEPLYLPDAYERADVWDLVGEISVVPNDDPLVTLGDDRPLDLSRESFRHNADFVAHWLEVERDKISIWPCYHRAGWTYAESQTFLRAEAFARVYQAAKLLPDEFGLAILDGWRSLELQKEIYREAYQDSKLPAGFVTEPSTDTRFPPPHLTGGTVDLTLSYAGVPLALGTLFDDFTPAAHAMAFEDSRDFIVRDLRRMLISVMRSAGFIVLQNEWWHFEYGTRRWAAINEVSPIYGAAEPVREIEGPRPGIGFGWELGR